MKSGNILGLSAYYHDASAALLREGEIIAAAQEERFTRIKNDERFPRHAVEFCLRRGGLKERDLDAVVFYDKPVVKFARLLESFMAVAPGGFKSFLQVMPSWLNGKLNLRKTIREELPGLTDRCRILFTHHHQAHAASAFYPSPFEESAILAVDGVGEYATTTLGLGRGNQLDLLKELCFPHSLGLLYSAFTAYCGFRVNSGEYKLMGLAPYGEPKWIQAIYGNLIDLKEDGSFRLNLEYFDFLRGLRMTNGRFHRLFGGPPRDPDAPLETRHMDIARSIQAVTEEIMLRLARHVRDLTNSKNLCLAGGVALNCVANGKILREKIFDRIWIQPAAGDAGGALGAALVVHRHLAEPDSRKPRQGGGDDMNGALLGPDFTDAEIETTLVSHQAVYEKLEEGALLARTAELLGNQKVVGWFQGRMEFGPRALGNRSILGDARSPGMQSVINLKVKFRESFRPFAPVVRRERVSDYFELDQESPYMLLVAPVKKELCSPESESAGGLERLKQVRSSIPAVTHVDYSARIQTISREQNHRLYALLERFEEMTGCGVLVNTSFNVRSEPVVCSPDDAYRCFVNTEMDHLVIGNYILDRAKQSLYKPAPRFAALPDHAGRPKLKEDPREWMKFTGSMGVALGMLAVLLWKRRLLSQTQLTTALGFLSAALLICLIHPAGFRRFYRAGMTVGFYLGQWVGQILLTLLFWLGLTPLGLGLRLFGKDLLSTKKTAPTSSYWRPARVSKEFDRQF